VEDLEICLDTDILIDFLRGERKIVDTIKTLEEEHELLTTSINIFELYYGAHKTGKDKNVRAVDELTGRLEILKLTERSAKISGKILAELESEGKVIDFRDILIAGIAMENDVTLFTRNKKHFQRVKGLKLFENRNKHS
jgi:predicted nucleic acid-binding protein